MIRLDIKAMALGISYKNITNGRISNNRLDKNANFFQTANRHICNVPTQIVVIT